MPSGSTPARGPKPLVVPTQEAWAAAFKRINTPALREMARRQLVGRHHQHNASALIDILFPDIARTLAVRPSLSDADVRKFVRGAISRAISNDTQRGTEAGTKKREVPFNEGERLVHLALLRRAEQQSRERDALAAEGEVIWHASREMNARQRQMLVMALDGKTPREMAVAMGLPLETARTSWYRLVRRLKRVAEREHPFHLRLKRKPRRPSHL